MLAHMAKTSAHTRTYASVKAMANLAVHNTREWNEDHPAPWYLLAEEHRDPRGNVEITRDLTTEMVIREYLETNRFGMKHGKLHHKAKPLRETVVVCEARHGREDMEKLMATFERELPFRCMYGYLHRDEGHIDKKTGIVKHNWHMHIGHTNLIDGELVDPGKAGLKKLQDICAEVLDMERGTPAEEREEKRPHLTPREYRRMARERDRSLAAERTQAKVVEETNRELTEQLAIRHREYDGLKNTNQVLSAENVRLKEDLERSNAAREADEQALERLKNDPDLDLGPGLDTAEDLATRLIETNRSLRKRIQESGRGTPQIYKRLKEIKMSDQPIPDRLKAMVEYVDELTQDTPAPADPAEAGHDRVATRPSPAEQAAARQTLDELDQRVRARARAFQPRGKLSRINLEQAEFALQVMDRARKTSAEPYPSREEVAELKRIAAGEPARTPAPEPQPSPAPAPALAGEFKAWLAENQATSSSVVEVNRELRQRLKDSGQARREDYMGLKAIKEDPNLDEAARIVRMTEYVDERLAHREPPAPDVLADTSQDVPDEPRLTNARPVLEPAARTLIDEREQARLDSARANRDIGEIHERLNQAYEEAEKSRKEKRKIKKLFGLTYDRNNPIDRLLIVLERLLETKDEKIRTLEEKLDAVRKDKAAAEETSRKETIEQRDRDWQAHLEKQRKQAARDIEQMALPAANLMETGGGYRERISDLFTNWRAKLLTYVAHLKQSLQRAEHQVIEQAQRNQAIIEQDRPYRELVAVMTPEEKANLDGKLEEITAERQEARARARRDRDRDQERDPGGPELGG